MEIQISKSMRIAIKWWMPSKCMGILQWLLFFRNYSKISYRHNGFEFRFFGIGLGVLIKR